MKSITKLLTILTLVMLLAGCGLSMDTTNNPKEIDTKGLQGGLLFGREESSTAGEKNDLFDATFDLLVEEFVQDYSSSSYLKGVDASFENPSTREMEGELRQIRHRYRLDDNTVLFIYTVPPTKQITRVEIQTPADQKNPQFSAYTTALADLLLDHPEEYLLEEILAYFRFVEQEAERTGYREYTIQYNDRYCTFQMDSSGEKVFVIEAVSQSEPYRSLSYFDGERYHRFYEENGMLRDVTDDDLIHIATEDYHGLKEEIPSKLRKDLPEEALSLLMETEEESEEERQDVSVNLSEKEPSEEEIVAEPREES